MSPAGPEKNIAGISPKCQGERIAFVLFLPFKQAEEAQSGERMEAGAVSRRFGGGGNGCFMAPGFDARLADFAGFT